MEIKKKFIGKYKGPHGETEYYMIQKGTFFGVEVLEGNTPELTSTIEWFSEDQEKTIYFVKQLCQYGASAIHLGELIDNYME